MAYRFKRKQSVSENFHRVALDQVEAALAQLARPHDEVHDAVHLARKCFKRVRGLLKLVRPAIGDAYRTENAAFRDIGRSLSELRDAQARLECLDALIGVFAEELSEEPFPQVRRLLARDRDAAEQDHVHEAQVVRKVCARLAKASGRLGRIEFARQDRKVIQKGILKTYRRGRRAMRRAYGDGSDEAFHEWRKRVKYLWYQVCLLESVWPRPMAAMRKELHRLADLLGDDHDLVVFGEYLDSIGADSAETDALCSMVTRRHVQLRNSARPLGARLFAERPGRFARRIADYWCMWRLCRESE